MPNWCHNRVDLMHNDPQEVAALVHIFENPQPFAALIPEPDWLTGGLSGIFPKSTSSTATLTASGWNLTPLGDLPKVFAR